MRAWVVMVVAATVCEAREYAFGGPAPVAPAPVRFAAGSTVGPWAWLESGFFGAARGPWGPTNQDLKAGAWWWAMVGFGVDAGVVHLRPSATIDAIASLERFNTVVAAASPLSLALAATNLLDDTRFTGLRLTPAVGVTVPTRVASDVELTTLSAALQLERRFGPVELALRVEASKPFWPLGAVCIDAGCRTPIDWMLDDSLRLEWWVSPRTSIGVNLGWLVAFNFLLPGAFGVPAQTTPDTRQSTRGGVRLSHAFHRLFGLTFSFDNQQDLLGLDGRPRVPFFGLQRVTGSMSLWFRTDATLERNWLER